ncbi:hypothetical protein [Caldisalinibacter kiritimatiensis]|uniref:Uncharacterized protein n=1 Tax=Caldisalinibacter kiritimatiensis TaxID=1304284 RepID=R1AWU8_9FIRM|nr:hypothetical protein [Caldisalinibacter kiritimatiensis]EOD01673.1 hypothetical protein L21TH_0214 [Caldisalinibacter kiritimatiensis]
MLLDTITDKHKIISIVGMAKNAGKTVTLNHIIEEALYKDMVLGLTSTGRDGESQDIVTNTEKPMIYVSEGTIVATTADFLDKADAKVEVLKITDYSTPLGYVVIGRVRDSGYIQIAGPQTNKDIREICTEMLYLGAQLVVIDGALDRMSSAAPTISEGTILATGAVLSRDMNKVIEKTLHTIELFRLPEITGDKERSIIRGIFERNKTALIDKDYNVTYLDIKTALNSGNVIGSNLKEDTIYVVVTGALVKKTIEDVIKNRGKNGNIKFVVRDGTKIFIDAKSWQRFKRMGIKVEVLHSIETLAVTLNPYSPQGYYFEPKKFLDTMNTYLKDIPVFDVVLGGGENAISYK